MLENPLLGRVWSRDPWPQPFPAWLKLGILTPERIYTSHLYFPGAMDRALITGGHDIEPFWYTVGDPPTGFLSLGPRETQDRSIVPIGETTLLSMAAYSSLAAGFRVSVFDVDGDGRPMRRWNRGAVNNCNFAGSGFSPLIFRTPVTQANQQPILFRVTNLSGEETNNVQISIHSVRRRYE